jgi:thioredoxin 2
VRLVVTCLACAAKNRVPAARLADRSRCAKCQQPLTPVTQVLPVEAESVLDAMATSTVPVLVWLGAAWSGPSSLLGIELDKLATERAGHLVVVRIDVDHRPNLARRFLVESVPTMVLLRRGREEGREVGVLPASALRKRFGI